MVAHLTGLEIEWLCARLDIIGEGRVLDDNASIMVNYKGGAKGLYWSSQIAVGHDNGFRVRIYGDEGLRRMGPRKTRITSGPPSSTSRPRSLSRGRDKMYSRGPGALQDSLRPPRGLFRVLRQPILRLSSRRLAKKTGRRAADGRRPRFSGRRGRRPGRQIHREMRRKLRKRERRGSTFKDEDEHGETSDTIYGTMGGSPFRGGLQEGEPGATMASKSPAGATIWTSERRPATGPTSRKSSRSSRRTTSKCWALGAHLAGQCVGDSYDERLDGFAPDAVEGRSPKRSAPGPSKR